MAEPILPAKCWNLSLRALLKFKTLAYLREVEMEINLERHVILAIDRASKRLGRDPLTHPRSGALRATVINLFEQGYRDFELVAGIAAIKELHCQRHPENGIVNAATRATRLAHADG
jgi:hypothetical protein